MNRFLKFSWVRSRNGILGVCVVCAIGVIVSVRILNAPATVSLNVVGYNPTTGKIALCLTNGASSDIGCVFTDLLQQRIGGKWKDFRKKDEMAVADPMIGFVGPREDRIIWIELPETTNTWRAGFECIGLYGMHGNPPAGWRLWLQPYSEKIGLNVIHKQFTIWSREIHDLASERIMTEEALTNRR
jgi:hypothetical protein